MTGSSRSDLEPADEEPSVRVVSGDDNACCPQCSRPGLLSALVPHKSINSRGESTPGRAVAVLCAQCDIGDREAGALISFLTVHGEITEETVTEASHLISAWAKAATPKPVNLGRLDAENEQWLRDEL